VQYIYTTTELLVLAGCTAQVLYKPRAVKMQKEAALEGGPGGRNYNPEALEASKLRSLKLDGTRVALRADFCRVQDSAAGAAGRPACGRAAV